MRGTDWTGVTALWDLEASCVLWEDRLPFCGRGGRGAAMGRSCNCALAIGQRSERLGRCISPKAEEALSLVPGPGESQRREKGT